LGQLGFFVRTDGERVHGGRIVTGRLDGNGRWESDA
jgi:hypothetical protein